MGGKLKLRKRIKALQKIVEMENSDIPYSTIAIAKEIGVSKATVSNYRKAPVSYTHLTLPTKRIV